MMNDMTVQQILQSHKKHPLTLVDVRSPKEFNEATIPGSINIPLFNNEERAEVGTLYKQKGQETAKQRGLEIFSAKLPQFIDQFKTIDSDIAVFCWRGGMRSRTAATVLDLMGIQANRLNGGYRAYRRWVVNALDNDPIYPEFYVLDGFTGSGKTDILKRLAAKGEPVIDLEQMAGHRGSIFGHIGLEPSNQKSFDANLFQSLLSYQNKTHLFIEGESKRIGKVVLPDPFLHQKETGKHLFVNLPMEERVQNILQDYQPQGQHESFMEAFSLIRKHIHTPIAKDIQTKLENKQYPEAVELLLQHYYDPRYEHAIGDKLLIHIQAQNTVDAADQIVQMLNDNTI